MGCMPSKKKRSRISTSVTDGQRHAFQTAIVCVVNRHRVVAAAGSDARPCEPLPRGNAAAMEEEEEVLSLAFPDQGEAMAALFQVVMLNAVVITGKQPHKVQMLELGAKDWRSWWSLRGLAGWGIARLWRPRRSLRVRGTKVLIVPPGGVPGGPAATHGHHVDAVLAAESWADLLHRMWTLECPVERPHNAGLLAGRCKLTGAVAATAPAATCTSSSSVEVPVLPWAELTLDLVFLPSRVSRSRRREARRKLKRVVAGTARRRAVSRKLRDACVVWPRLQLTLTLASQDGQQGGATATAITIHAVMRALFALQDCGRSGSGPSAGELGRDWGQNELALSLGCVTCPSAVTVVKQAHSVSQQDDDPAPAGPRTWPHTVSSASCAAAAVGAAAVAPPVPVKSLRLGVDTEVRFVERHQQQACAMAEDATAGGAGGAGTGLFEDRRMRVDAVWKVVKLDSGFDPYQYRFRVSRNLFVRTEAGTVLVHHTWSRGLTLYHRTSECWKKISHPLAS